MSLWSDRVRARVLVAVMLSTGLVALDNTVVATAAPGMVRDLGGFAQLPWVFSAYLLAQAAGTPVMGKLCDLLGRRPVMTAGIIAFAAGSLACGLAWDMPSLVAARVVQGLGAGAVQAIGMTVVGDMYEDHERGNVQGYLAGMWGLASVLGPAVGGALADAAGWRWVFLVNLPLCVLAGIVFLAGHREARHRPTGPVDWLGASLLTLTCSLFLLAILNNPWLFLGGAACLFLLVIVERRAADPVLPRHLFSDRTAIGSNLASFGLGATMFGVSAYVPTYAQGVLGSSAFASGMAIAPLMIGWPIAAAVSAKLYLRLGYRDTALLGGLVAVLGTGSTVLLGPSTPLVLASVSVLVIGLGLGLATTPLMIAVQNAAPWEQRGAVTATAMFARSLGSATGVAVLGAVAATAPAGRLADATHRVFIGLAGIAVLLVAAVLVMRRNRPVLAESPRTAERKVLTS